MAYEKVKYNNEYNKKNYTAVTIRLQKGQKAIIDEHWKNKGFKSLNSYINHLIAVDIQATKEQKINVENNSGINDSYQCTDNNRLDIYNTFNKLE